MTYFRGGADEKWGQGWRSHREGVHYFWETNTIVTIVHNTRLFLVLKIGGETNETTKKINAPLRRFLTAPERKYGT